MLMRATFHSPYVKAELGSGRSAGRSIFSKRATRLVWYTRIVRAFSSSSSSAIRSFSESSE